MKYTDSFFLKLFTICFCILSMVSCQKTTDGKEISTTEYIDAKSLKAFNEVVPAELQMSDFNYLEIKDQDYFQLLTEAMVFDEDGGFRGLSKNYKSLSKRTDNKHLTFILGKLSGQIELELPMEQFSNKKRKNCTPDIIPEKRGGVWVCCPDDGCCMTAISGPCDNTN